MNEFKYKFQFDSEKSEQLFLHSNNVISNFLLNEYNINIVGRIPDVVVTSKFSKHYTTKFLDEIVLKLNNLDEFNISDIVRIYDELDIDVFYEEELIRDFKGKNINVKSKNQKYYVDSIMKNDLVFGVGPAGTGKTFLAVCLGVKLLKLKEVDKIIITRPAIEAGESLGFLPGDLKDKVDPYLQPIYDSLNILLGVDVVEKLIEKKVVEIAPIAFMRGRTLNNAFVILDEAQNTTKEQMKMFLTRLGVNSKMVVTGDSSQIDLKNKQESGLLHAIKLLDGINGIDIIQMKSIDVMRHYLVRRIVDAYEKN